MKVLIIEERGDKKIVELDENDVISCDNIEKIQILPPNWDSDAIITIRGGGLVGDEERLLRETPKTSLEYISDSNFMSGTIDLRKTR